MTATVLIVTRNRREELRVAITSSIAQTVPVEVIVIDDGSTDGTAEFVQANWPDVMVVRHEDARGYVVRRNEGVRLAGGDVVFSLDDDAAFISPHTVAQTLCEFDEAHVGAVAIPYREPKKHSEVLQRAPAAAGIWITDCYVGTAHAVRRDVFLRVGGYRESLVHQGEERDFCIRLLARGHVVRLGRADAIAHYESPKRDLNRMDRYGRRNDVLFAWHCVPLPFLPVHMAATTLNGLRAAWATRRPLRMLDGIASGYARCFYEWNERSPVSVPVYRLHRKLRKSGPYRLADVVQYLPA